MTLNHQLRSSARQQLAPRGRLRVALNMSNFLLVNTTDRHGHPDGVSPAMARSIAEDLDVTLELKAYDGPGQVADAVRQDAWDLANIAAEPERAKTITFSQAYCEIQASYLVPPGSILNDVADVDRPGMRIAVKQRAAYDLWLTANLQYATLHRADSMDGAFDLFVNQKLDALAGLRPKLQQQQVLLPGSVLLDKSFTAVQQSIGCKPEQTEAAAYIDAFVAQAKASGMVRRFLKHYGVDGQLSAAR